MQFSLFQIGNTGKFCPGLFLPVKPCQHLFEGIFPFSPDQKIHKGILLKSLFRVITYFRSPYNDLSLGPDLLPVLSQTHHILNIPQITGKTDHIRFSVKQIRQNLLNTVIDGVFCNLNLIPVFSGVCLQRTDCQVRMYIFGIDTNQHNLHIFPPLFRKKACHNSKPYHSLYLFFRIRKSG